MFFTASNGSNNYILFDVIVSICHIPVHIVPEKNCNFIGGLPIIFCTRHLTLPLGFEERLWFAVDAFKYLSYFEFYRIEFL